MRCCGGLSRNGEVRLLLVHLLVALQCVDPVAATSTVPSTSSLWMRLPYARRTKDTTTNPLDAVRSAASKATALLTPTAAARPNAAAAVVGLGAMVAAGVALPAWFSGGSSSDRSSSRKMTGRSSSRKTSRNNSKSTSRSRNSPAIPTAVVSTRDGASVPSLVISTTVETIGLWSILVAAHAVSERLSLPVLSRVLWGDLPGMQWAALGLVIFGSGVVQRTMRTVWHTVVVKLLGTGRTRSSSRHNSRGSGSSSNNSSSSSSSSAVFASTDAQVLQVQPTAVPSGESGEWYNRLKKPWFNPPVWLFPILWCVVCKPTQVYAVSRLLVMVPTPWWILGLYCLHFALGDAWNDVFFGQQRIRLGANVMVWCGLALLAAPVLLLVVVPDHGGGASSEATTAVLFLGPTLLWVAVATALNFKVLRLNPSTG